MTAALWISPFKVAELPPPELAVIVWSRAVIWPDVTLGAPPRPNAFPSATTVSPTVSDDESANLTVGRPDTLPSIWITAMSCEMSTPTTWAEYLCERPCTVTVMLVEPLTTWLLVMISPVELMSTMNAAIRFQIDAGRGGGAGIHWGGGPIASDVGGESKAWPGGLGAGCSGSCGFSSDIDLSSGNSLERCFVLQIAPASCEVTRRFLNVF